MRRTVWARESPWKPRQVQRVDSLAFQEDGLDRHARMHVVAISEPALARPPFQPNGWLAGCGYQLLLGRRCLSMLMA